MLIEKIVPSGVTPDAVGHYSQALRVDTSAARLIYVAGQIPVDPATNTLITGDFSTQVRQTLKNLESILHAAGSSVENVVKVEVFLHSIENFDEFNTEYAKFFVRKPLPARQTVEVSGLPMHASIEISCTALCPASS